MPATVASRQPQRYRSVLVAVAIALLGMGISGSASSADPGATTDGSKTASPIKHHPFGERASLTRQPPRVVILIIFTGGSRGLRSSAASSW
jgi:hypothetical protein